MTRRMSALAAAAITAAAVAAPSLAQSGGSATTVTFTELDKGSTFHFIDNPPHARKKHGFPTKLSPGDQMVISNPLRDTDATRNGELRATCTATHATRNFDNARFLCVGAFVRKEGTMFAETADIAGSTTTGAITGGTGAYAGARGTFTSTSTKSGSDDVITLLP